MNVDYEKQRKCEQCSGWSKRRIAAKIYKYFIVMSKFSLKLRKKDKVAHKSLFTCDPITNKFIKLDNEIKIDKDYKDKKFSETF